MSAEEPEYRKRQKETRREQRESQKDSHGQQIISTLERGINNAQAAHNEDAAAEKNRERWERRRFWLDLAAVVAVFLAATFAGCQLIFMRGQQIVMQGQLDEMQAARRPWVHPAEINIGNITWRALGASVPIRIVLKNTGQSPALYVDREEEVCVSLADCLKWMRDTRARLKGDNYTAGKPVFPNETTTPFIDIHTLTRSDVELFRQQINHAVHSRGDPLPPPDNDPHLSVPVYVAYVIDYMPDVGGIHHQTFCWLQVYRVNPANPGLGLSIQLDQDIPGGQLFSQDGEVSCGAD